MRLVDSSFNTFYLQNSGNLFGPPTIGAATSASPGNLILQGSGGYVGIGITSPGVPLHVLTSAGINSSSTNTGQGAADLNFYPWNVLSANHNIRYTLSGRNTTGIAGELQDLLMYSYDGTTYRDFMRLIHNGGNHRVDMMTNLAISGVTPNGGLAPGVNGIQMYFTSNAGMITSTEPSVANRQLSIQGHPLIFQANGTEVMRLISGGNVGIGTSSPAAKLDVNGNGILKGLALPVSGTKTSTYNATVNDFLIPCNTTTAGFNVNLPQLSSVPTGFLLSIKKVSNDSNTLTIDGNASETIDGQLTQSTTTRYKNFLLIAGSSEWHILSTYL